MGMLFLKRPLSQLGVVVHVYSPGTLEAEVEGSRVRGWSHCIVNLNLVWVQEILSQIKQSKEKQTKQPQSGRVGSADDVLVHAIVRG